jgi:geranylgeranyl diphosphate synthase type I
MTLSTAALAVTEGPRIARGYVMARVEDRMGRFLDEERARWIGVDSRAIIPVESIAALIGAGGKRLRPTFCVSGFLAAGGDLEDDTVVGAAVALEFLHACALIHDDIMDDSPLRRGAPTVHTQYTAEHSKLGMRGEGRRYGESVALLTGDLALVYSDAMIGSCGSAARKVWDEARSELIIGQFLDMAAAAQSLTDPDLCRWIALCKSGRYTIDRPLALGATLAGAPELVPALSAYGLALGEAFQLRDDLLDVYGDPAVLGKPTGHDVDQHKMTLLLALAVQRDESIRRMVAESDGALGDPTVIRRLFADTRVLDDIEMHIGDLVRRARASIADAPISDDWRQELADLALSVAYRDR